MNICNIFIEVVGEIFSNFMLIVDYLKMVIVDKVIYNKLFYLYLCSECNVVNMKLNFNRVVWDLEL